MIAAMPRQRPLIASATLTALAGALLLVLPGCAGPGPALDTRYNAQGQTALNAIAIGLEIVNPGPQRQANGNLHCAPQAPAQIDALIALLRDILSRHPVQPDRIINLSDIVPQRKCGPGPAFPCRPLAAPGRRRAGALA